MIQPTKGKRKTTGKKPDRKKGRPRQKFGTSKLEADFARDFLDRLGLKFISQFEAKDIGRFYDFYLPDKNLLIEVDGGYYHSDPRVVDPNNLNPMQKRNKRVDELKNKWALAHGIPIVRIWEEDIRKNPAKVLEELSRHINLSEKSLMLAEKRSKRKNNRLK